jgi:periplasmic protein TonB
MPTAIEIQKPEVREELRATAPPISQRRAEPEGPAVPPRVLFSDSLLETGTPDRARRSLATTLSIILQCVLVGFMLIVPLMFTEALPAQQFLTFLVAPPPPPPPPPPAAAVKVVRQTDVTTGGHLRTPTRIPRKVEMIREEEAPLPSNGGVVGGIPGGVPGGQLNGVIGGIISSTPIAVAIPKLEPVKRIRISQGVTQGMVINKIEPTYPRIALSAHISGVVTLKAIIGKGGDIKELQTVSGHPILVPAAIDAVKQWRYRPYLLNGEPVEVETIITVTFQIQT